MTCKQAKSRKIDLSHTYPTPSPDSIIFCVVFHLLTFGGEDVLPFADSPFALV